MDLIVSEPPEGQVDPVVIVMPIEWMRPIIKKYPKSFNILIGNLIGYGQFGENDLDKSDYLTVNSGEHASIDDIMGWAQATKEMMLQIRPDGSSWDFVRKKTPTDVMMGFDMEIGGDGEGHLLAEFVESLPEDVNNLVFPTHGFQEGVEGMLQFLGSNQIDDEKTIRMLSTGSDEYIDLQIGKITVPIVEELFESFNFLPKALYKIKNLSDMNQHRDGFNASINYHKLKI